MLEEYIRLDTKIRLYYARQEHGEYENEEKNLICRGVVSKILSESELEIALSDADVEQKLQKEVCYVMYLYTPQELLVGSVYYHSFYQAEEKKLLTLEVVSPFERVQRRMYQRVACHSKVSFRQVSREMVEKREKEPLSFDSKSASSEAFEDTMADISGGGIRFTTRSHIPVDEYLFVCFEIMNEKRAVEMTAFGQVVYSKLLPNEQDCCDIRMKYIGLSEEERKKIIHFVFQLERDSISDVKWHRGGE